MACRRRRRSRCRVCRMGPPTSSGSVPATLSVTVRPRRRCRRHQSTFPQWPPSRGRRRHWWRRWLRCLGSARVRSAWPGRHRASDGGSPVTDYVIEQSTNGTTWATVVDGVSTATSHTVSGLSNGTAYQFRVSARNAVGDGPSSVAVTATPRTVPSVPLALVAAVAPVSGVGSGQVRLTWSAPPSMVVRRSPTM